MSNISIRKVKKLLSKISDFTISKFKNSTSKQKIYIGIGLFLFLLQFFMGGDTLYRFTDSNYILIFSIIGLLIALNRRRKSRNFINEKKIFNIIYSDYNFSSYASLSLLSLFYAILQGLLLGTSFGFIFYAVGCLFYGSINLFGINIAAFFLCIIFILLTRFFLECVSLIFTTVAEDKSKVVNK
tara:strand:- start:428 stop:979 length:552 start_codon:yes stop_codon:yes gene_type:complete